MVLWKKDFFWNMVQEILGADYKEDSWEVYFPLTQKTKVLGRHNQFQSNDISRLFIVIKLRAIRRTAGKSGQTAGAIIALRT